MQKAPFALAALILCCSVIFTACGKNGKHIESETTSSAISEGSSFEKDVSSRPGNSEVSHTAVNSYSSEKSSSPSKSNDYSSYTGYWRASDDLNMGQYEGTTMDLSVDKAGNLSGIYHRATQNGGMLADADFTGKITADGKGQATFADDDWGHAGTITFSLQNGTVDTTLTYTKVADTSDFGVRTGPVHFVKG